MFFQHHNLGRKSSDTLLNTKSYVVCVMCPSNRRNELKRTDSLTQPCYEMKNYIASICRLSRRNGLTICVAGLNVDKTLITESKIKLCSYIIIEKM
jgi:hypothetical protein